MRDAYHDTMTNSPEIEMYWQMFLQSLSGDRRAKAHLNDVGIFGDTESLSDELCELVRRGIKTATCASLHHMQQDADPIPQIGSFSIVTDFFNKPLCILEYTDVFIRPYNEVDAQFAFDEGEDDRTLDAWRTAHRNYFTRTLIEAGLSFSEDMPLVCQRFRIVFPMQMPRVED